MSSWLVSSSSLAITVADIAILFKCNPNLEIPQEMLLPFLFPHPVFIDSQLQEHAKSTRRFARTQLSIPQTFEI